RGQEGPDVARRKGGDVIQSRRLAEMTGQESQECGDVAVIGFHRLGAHAPLDGEIGKPLRLGGGKVGGSDEDWQRSVHAASVAQNNEQKVCTGLPAATTLRNVPLLKIRMESGVELRSGFS